MVVVALLAGGAFAARADSTWVDHYRAAQAAHAAGDVAAYRDGLLRVAEELGDQPGVNYGLARAAARLGDRAEALRRLRLYASSGLVRDAVADSDFVSLWRDPEFAKIVARIRANGDPVGTARVQHRFRDHLLLTEDLAHNPATGRFFATSIHRGRVVAVDARGTEREWRDPEARPGWGVFGASVDRARGLLWTSVAATPTAEGYSAGDSGRTALVAWDVHTGSVTRRIEWPRDGKPHLLGDLTVADDGTVYACDTPAGAVRRLRPGADSIDTVVPEGGFPSPQTPALAPGGRRLYVADYSRGIGVIDLATARVTWMTFAPGIALQGIDGLYAYGHDLIAVQNGTRPKRVMRFRLDSSGARVVSGTAIESGTGRLGEPTHGVVIGDDFCFLANTGWDRVGDDQRLSPTAADPPLILRARLGARR